MKEPLIFSIPISRLVNFALIGYCAIQPALHFVAAFPDGYGRIIMVLTALSLILNFPKAEFRAQWSSGAVGVWFTWIIYNIIFALKLGNPLPNVPDLFFFIFHFIFLPGYCLLVCQYETSKCPAKFVKLLVSSLSIYVIIGLFFGSGEVGSTGRGVTELGNMLPLTAMSLVGIASFANIIGKIKSSTLYAIIFLALIATFFVATRKALVGIVIIMMFYSIYKWNLMSSKNLPRFIIALLILYVAYYIVMHYTLVGDRFINDVHSSDNYVTTGGNNLFFKLVGDRTQFYLIGTELFLNNNIWTGIGLMHFMEKAHYTMPIHSEYVVQYCECGIIGLVIYLVYIFKVFKSYYSLKPYNQYRGVFLISIGWYATYLFIGLTAWTYQFPFYFMVTGSLLGYDIYAKKQLKQI